MSESVSSSHDEYWGASNGTSMSKTTLGNGSDFLWATFLWIFVKVSGSEQAICLWKQSCKVAVGLHFLALWDLFFLVVLFEVSPFSSVSQDMGNGKCSRASCPWTITLWTVGVSLNQLQVWNIQSKMHSFYVTQCEKKKRFTFFFFFFAISRVLNLVNLVNFSLPKVQQFIHIKIQSLWMC